MNRPFRFNRRHALTSSLAWAGAAVAIPRGQRAFGFAAANSRPRMAAIGTGSRWRLWVEKTKAEIGTAPAMKAFGDYVVVCDVDQERRDRAAAAVKDWAQAEPEAVPDYRAVIDRDDIDIVHITTPDHWHAKIAIEALLAGKDVYCEKPLTLTIEEGQRICEVVKKTGRILQVGAQQRSMRGFLTAIALVRAGRIGTVKKAVCGLDAGQESPALPVVAAPQSLDWDRWLGPAPKVPFRYLAGDHGETKSWSRCHYEFRWWYEYSGGKLTDWGAHHCDIATWALGKETTGPVVVTPVHVRHGVEFRDGMPTDDSRYNTPIDFAITATFADGAEIELRSDGDNGILFEGTEGRIFVNRGRLTGKAVDDLKSNPLPDGALEQVYKDGPVVDHFRNFFDSVVRRREPIADVFSHHRALTTCHLAGIAARVGRPVRWNPDTQAVIDDPLAQSFVAREPRQGFGIET